MADSGKEESRFRAAKQAVGFQARDLAFEALGLELSLRSPEGCERLAGRTVLQPGVFQ